MPQPFRYRIGFLGCPSVPDVPWTRANLAKLVDLGFNTVQLNIAWGGRPGDDPLNLEDVVDPTALPIEHRQSLPLNSNPDLAQVKRRRADLHHRIALCQEAGLRTIFHFGAPYNPFFLHSGQADTPPSCLLDPAVLDMYKAQLQAFADQFPGVDDILVYTYDQDAWLCSEFGDCPNCRGIPLHKRVSSFVNQLAETWRNLSPNGKLWWEPWELSAGQVLRTVELLDASRVGLALHSNIAEVIVTMPVDRWLRNTVRLAKDRGISVVVEHFLGAPTEEVEPFVHLTWPLVIWRGLKTIATLEVDGIKEYYGLVPTKEDANLRMAGLFLENPDRTESEALEALAQPYSEVSRDIMAFWTLTSEATMLFPWYTSWFIREIGKCDPVHAMSAAFIRGQQCHTPSWESTRSAIFMKTDNAEPDPWLLEDVQLQCEMAAKRIDQALQTGESIQDRVPEALRAVFAHTLADFRALRQRILSYAYHIRETNLTTILRHCTASGQLIPENVLQELRTVLVADQENQEQEEPLGAAIALLDKDPQDFADTYFVPGDPDELSHGYFSVTSR